MTRVDGIVRGLNTIVTKLNKLQTTLDKKKAKATIQAVKHRTIANTHSTEIERAKAIAKNISSLLNVESIVVPKDNTNG